MAEIMNDARELAKVMFEKFAYHEHTGCGNLMLEWTKEHFWGRVIEDYIPLFNELWTLLDSNKYTKNNQFSYGDADEYVWVEYPKNKNKKVIVSRSACTCADDNTIIYVLESEFTDWTSFRVSTVWPRQKKHNWDSPFSDDRDIKIPSLNTYRKRDFKYGYEDGRDEGHVIAYDNHFGEGKATDAHYNETQIPGVLRTLKWDLDALTEEIENR